MSTRCAALVLLALAGAVACDRAPVAAADAGRPLDVGRAPAARPPLDAAALPEVARPDALSAPDAAPASDARVSPDVTVGSIDDLSLDDLRLIAVAATGNGPVAMVTTPWGLGVTLRRGMYVGRPERVGGPFDAGAPGPVVRWRVARITPSRLRREPDGRLVESPADVVFARPDPNAPATPEERSLALSPPDAGRDVGSIRLVGAAPAADVPPTTPRAPR